MNELHRRSRRTLAHDNLTKVTNDQQVNPPPMTDKLFTKIQLRFDDDDQAALDQIRAAVRAAINDMFTGLMATVDEFYASFRQAKVNEHGVTVLDTRNRIVWATDEYGRFLDDFSNLSGQDVEIALLKIFRDKLDLVVSVDELFQQALFAKNTFDDVYQERYESLVEGTVADRNARASRDTKRYKYHAYFTYYLYSQSDVLLKEVNELARILERIRQWRIQDQYTERQGVR